MVQLTNETGSLTKAYEYDAFGNEKTPDPDDTNPFRYCGEYFDNETGTIYLRARYYNPATGRFISEDSYWGDLKDPLSLNLYTYGGNNPIMYIDPSGNSYTLTWKENMSWLPVVDGHMPVGDLIYYIGLGVSYCADNWGTISTVGPAAWEWTTDEAAPWVSNAARDTGNWISDKATKGWNWLKSQFGAGSSGRPDPNDLKKAVEANEGAGKVLNPSEAAKKIVNAERVGSGLKGDTYHRAASYLSESQLSKGTVYDLGKNNTLLQVEGSVNGKTGIFEYILNKNGQVTHQLFKEGGVINGIPN